MGGVGADGGGGGDADEGADFHRYADFDEDCHKDCHKQGGLQCSQSSSLKLIYLLEDKGGGQRSYPGVKVDH